MKRTLKSYIDLILIDEYADKRSRDGYSLHVSDLTKNELTNFLEHLFEHDDASRELILERMQDVINERLPIKEAEDKYDSGLIPRVDSVNGEVFWYRRSV